MSLIMILVKEGEQVQRNNLNATAFEPTDYDREPNNWADSYG
jgi:hypothetical protein